MVFPLQAPISNNEIVKLVCGGDLSRAEYVAKYVNENLDTDKKGGSRGLVTTLEAQTFLDKFNYGHHPSFKDQENPYPARILSVIRGHFFGGSAFDEKHSTMTPMVIPSDKIVPVDGDTIKFAIGSGFESLRFSGGDTPESKKNAKLEKVGEYSWKMWNEAFRIGGEREGALIKDMIDSRSRYGGLIAAAVTAGFVSWARAKGYPISIDVAFDRVDQSPEKCNVVTSKDKYDRTIGVPKIGTPREERNLMAEFIATALPKIVETSGAGLYNYYSRGEIPADIPSWWKTLEPLAALSKPGQSFLEYAKGKPKMEEVWRALSPSTLPDPSKMFSKKECEEMAREWMEMTKEGPASAYRNDLQAMLAFIGVMWAYPKYYGNNTFAYLKFEEVAIGKSPIHGEENKKTHGLNGDVIFDYGRPNPNHSKLYNKYGGQLSEYRELLPKDCCEVLESTGGDIYDHCY